MYRERPSLVPGAVLWHTSGVSEDAERRVLPDGCMDLLWTGGALVVAGPDAEAYVTRVPAGTAFTGLRLAPGTAPAMLGVPAAELRGLRVPLADLWPAADVRRLTDRVRRAESPPACLEQLAGERLDGVDPLVREAAVLLGRGSGVTATAAALGLGERRLHRLSLTAFGYGPKTLARILRMNRALALARSGHPFADVAATAGYADQAHLSREVRSLAGVPLGDLVG
ncbi:AraC family transcriptional regulator [Acrocarpospora phusangensis]|uniref:AraC family transcriptional regulator n=1 Tax=Acrocarpospora phusangensis TaxID=1070424 RepID=A0A919QJV6_9ACTN|nr:helix-turn-helix transcriptional regulator [Acrocarpospora phusangensis]GIH29008.1 AraC family transcriptional regulator [Acrocarpospora phusangensis]